MPAKKATKKSEVRSSESVVIYIHGIGEQPPKTELKLRWDLALFGRDLGTRSRMAYWSDLLRSPSASASKRAASRAIAQPNVITIDDILDGAGGEDAREFSLALLRQLGVNEDLVRLNGPARQGVGKKILPLPSWARRPISRAFLEAFIRDTAAYFFDATMRERMRERLRTELQRVELRNTTLIAHSQGSIIAYEVLAAMQPTKARSATKPDINDDDTGLASLVTIGSPLGIQEVQDFLVPTDRSLPQVAMRWRNFSDPLDPVAFDKGLSGDFRTPGRTWRIRDEIIVNGQSRQVWGFNPHSAVGYLSHPSVRRVVADAMRLDYMSRFVLARDVAERLGADPQDRHSVLIEVLEPGYGALDESRAQTERLEAKALSARHHDTTPSLLLRGRIDDAAQKLALMVQDPEQARIDKLRRFVSARLTADELQRVAEAHKDLRVYAVWQSAPKSKTTDRRSLSAIKADAAYVSFAADGSAITWAVLDTGVQANHPHFAGRIKAVYDCTRKGPPELMKNATDADGHGTHVCGVIAGRSAPHQAAGTAPHVEFRGMAPSANLIVYKVLDNQGQGEDAWIIKALDHIAEQNDNVSEGLAIHGVNLSLGGPFDSTVYGCGFSPICAELRRLWRDGVLVVVACGNEGQMQVQTPDGEVEINTAMSVGDPANLEECIAVGSVNADRPHLYGVSSFSSRGPTADGRAKPDLVAPGERIFSANARWKRGHPDTHYYFESGTSMAAPHVSGLLAAFLSVRREFRGRPDEVKRILLDNCTDLGRDRYHQGRGLPNLMQMLLSV